MKLLITNAFQCTQEQIEQLKTLGFSVKKLANENEAVSEDFLDSDAVICNNLFQYNDIAKFKNLKMVHLTSAGLDRAPLNYIQLKKIELFSAKGVYSVPIAEWVILKILELYKFSHFFYKQQEKQKWEKHREILELSGKTACIVGFGDIGQAIAKRLLSFNVKIIAVDAVKINSSFFNDFYFVNSIDSVLKESDIIILALPLNSQTRHFINKEKLGLMKEKSVLINISRGGVIDEQALIAALKRNQIWGAALDVFEKEPLSAASPLWQFKNVIITPHNSFVSGHNNERMFKLILKNLSAFLNKRRFLRSRME